MTCTSSPPAYIAIHLHFSNLEAIWMKMQQLHGSNQNLACRHNQGAAICTIIDQRALAVLAMLESCSSDYVHDNKLWRGAQCSDAEDLIAEGCTKHASI